MSSAAFNPASWTNSFSITSASSQISEVIGAAMIDLSVHGTADFWSNVAADGGDIRPANEADDTAYSFYLINFSKGSQTGLLWFDCSDDISTSVDVTWHIWYGNGSASMPAVSDTLGRNNVWDTDTTAMWFLINDPSGSAPQLVDATGNGHDMTSFGTMTTGDLVDFEGGKGWEFDGSDDGASVAHAATFVAGNFTLLCQMQMPANAATMQLWSKTTSSGGVYERWLRVLSDGTVEARTSGNAGGAVYLNAASTGTVDDNSTHAIGWSHVQGTGAYLYIDGGLDGSSESPSGGLYVAGTTDVSIGARADGGQPFAGVVGFVQHIDTATPKSANWHATKNAMLVDSAFWAAGGGDPVSTSYINLLLLGCG